MVTVLGPASRRVCDEHSSNELEGFSFTKNKRFLRKSYLLKQDDVCFNYIIKRIEEINVWMYKRFKGNMIRTG